MLDIGTTRDRIARNARTNSGERRKDSFVRYPGGLVTRKRYTETRFTVLDRPTAKLCFCGGLGGKVSAPVPKTRSVAAVHLTGARNGAPHLEPRTVSTLHHDGRGDTPPGRFDEYAPTMKHAPNRRARFALDN